MFLLQEYPFQAAIKSAFEKNTLWSYRIDVYVHLRWIIQICIFRLTLQEYIVNKSCQAYLTGANITFENNNASEALLTDTFNILITFCV